MVIGSAWIFTLFHIISVPALALQIIAPVSIFILLLPAVVNHLMHLSDILLVGSKGINLLTGLILGCNLTAVFLLSSTLSHYASIIWLLPTLIACQYYSKRITSHIFLGGFVGMILSFYVSIYLGIEDLNLALVHLMPQLLIYCAAYPLFMNITKRTELLMKKQKLSMLAYQAKQTLDHLEELPDTYITDCRIKMRYLAKNGVDVDTALQNMDGNVDKYNDFLLTFVGESHRKEDELFTLMDSDTLLQYGAKVHALRVKSNALGLRNLTDTAFFHEIEAYAGNLEVIQNNWEKLSFEWDEACDVFTDYIQSLGLKDHATDGQGNQITFKKWGEQLHEAFDALETYDPDKARSILNELLQYQIDADITQNLQNIVANIDEVLKA
jgi:HPt (histidine-containing phosphotransfer) domain-containing protein